MENVQTIEMAVSRLSKIDLKNFRSWYEKFDQKAWDDQFKEDAKSGNLDMIADQAIADFKAGKCKEI
jgi:hypothetical protein